MPAQTSKPPAPSAPPPAPQPRGAAGGGLVLGLLAACNAMVMLDESMVNIALPAMSRDLGLTPVGLSWVVTAYLLPFGGLLLLGGRAGDLLGRRKVFLAGVTLFTLSAVLRAVAPAGEFLVAVRAVQGLGAALAVPSALALVLSRFPEGAARKRAIAVYTAVGAASTACGLLFSGALSSLTSWRGLLLLNVPLGLVVLVCVPLVVPETRRTRGRFDLAGALLSTGAAAALVYGLARVAEHPWDDPLVAATIAAGLALLALFLFVERRAEQPVVVLRLFADRNRACAYGATFAVQGALIGTGFFLVQFFQQTAGFTPLASAAALTPIALTMIAMSGVAVRLERRIGPRRLMLAGAALLAVANLWLAQLTPGSGYGDTVLPALLVFGSGMACCVIPATILGTSGLRSSEAGAASSVHNALQTVGASLGLAVLVTVATHAQRAADPGAAGFVAGMSASFTAGACCAAAAFAVALFIRPSGAAGNTAGRRGTTG
ncbi:MFS transporter [Streptomyces sp. S186]|uniref:MFS transporter n=1 Tax=Streptomyces sp. S186 TaxID=3434395 RepID=UPI003F66315D